MTTLVRSFLMFLCAGLMCTPAAFAHKASDAYLQLQANRDGIRLRLDVALRDLDAALDLDADGDGQLRWGEVRRAWPAIETYAFAGVQIEGCALNPAGHALERRSDGAYAVLRFESGCALAGDPVLHYRLMRDVDATHRGLLKIERPGQEPQLRVLDPASEVAVPPDSNSTLPGATAPPAAARGESFVVEGVRHILNGYDHVLFMLCLLLPAVMRREAGNGSGWQPVAGLGQALAPLARVITSFTIAHSITLALAATKVVALPAALIEPVIAVTIVLAAVDNLWPIFRGRRGLVTFAFGLVHGFGFAGALGELGLGAVQFAWALLKFNLGLELGQLMIVGLAVGALFLLRESPRYPTWAIRGGSVAAAVVGTLWFIERTAGLALLPS